MLLAKMQYLSDTPSAYTYTHFSRGQKRMLQFVVALRGSQISISADIDTVFTAPQNRSFLNRELPHWLSACARAVASTSCFH